ncbi:methyltransferase tpcM [Aspergillus homomorphus CBS 101889]|uniref:S-adenosyl-L-methionine-dependent methyltransferase n=1 Tax=Aspergillus homomorphus (strain CBS 101889) TaxID=1450537 RepID=A0A395HY60_ASPHC|nr:S-adenosyl-L-methionine-dependent methyltransferase [Aspergillus homomorphus CBS 101889]RAL12375.1 S-adenosyl-L-methionine-dependent methyltransferase [Aspergillus homomorphus CBS 101889]
MATSASIPMAPPVATTGPIKSNDQMFAHSQGFWDNYRRGRPQVPASFFERIYRYHRDHGGQFGTVHDVGAGVGPYAAELRTQFAHVIVSDLVATNVQQAEAHLGRDGFSYRAAPIEAADDLRPGSVDLVFATNVMHFADQPAAMAAIATQLHPGGTFACAGFGPARFADRAVQAVWERISQQGGRLLLGMAQRPQETVNVMARSSGPYNVAPLDLRWFRPGALRLHLNMAPNGGGITGLLPPERAHEITDPDFTGPADVVVEETTDDWRFETDWEGFLHHFRSFPHASVDPAAFTGLLQEMQGLLAQGRSFQGCWPATLILATRR